MNDQQLIKQLGREFDQDFGHLDFWWLSKKRKNEVYQDVAKRAIWLIRENDKFEKGHK